MLREIEDRQDEAENVYNKIELQAILSKVIGKLEPTSQMVLVTALRAGLPH